MCHRLGAASLRVRLQALERVDRFGVDLVAAIRDVALNGPEGVEVVVDQSLVFRLDRLIDECRASLANRLCELTLLVARERPIGIHLEVRIRLAQHLFRSREQTVRGFADMKQDLEATQREPCLQQLL
jgi:hypothetical protein